ARFTASRLRLRGEWQRRHQRRCHDWQHQAEHMLLQSDLHTPPDASRLPALASVRDIRRLNDRAAGIVLAFPDIAIDAAVVVGIGPYRAGQAAHGRADRGAFEDAEPAKRSARAGTQSAAHGCARANRAERRRAAVGRSGLVACWRPFIVLAVVDIAVSPAITVPVGPDRASQTTYSGADRSAGQKVSSGNRGDACAAGSADTGAGANGCEVAVTIG